MLPGGFIAGGSTLAVDTPANRVGDRLTAFLSKIEESEPVDNFFNRYVTIDHLKENAKVGTWGRQCWLPIDSGENSTVQDFADYDVFLTTPQSTAMSVGYPMVNKGGSVAISFEELQETKGSDLKVYDLLKHKRSNLLKTVMKKCNADLYATTAVAGKIEPLPVVIDSTGTAGSLSQSTDSDWASTETASGSFAAQGISDMTTMLNTLWLKKSVPTIIMTTQSVHEYMEKELSADVRYMVGDLQTGVRGFEGLKFKGVKLAFDGDCTSGVMYFINNENLFLAIDSDANFSFDPFIQPYNQRAQVALFSVRWALICNSRRAHGKLTGISA